MASTAKKVILQVILKVKHCLKEPALGDGQIEDALKMVRKVIGSKTWLFARHARKAMHGGYVSEPYMFESKDTHDRTLERALEQLERLEALPGQHLEDAKVDRIYQEIPGLLTSLRNNNA